MKKLSGLGTKTAAEFSLGVVKSFREDTLVAGLRSRSRPHATE